MKRLCILFACFLGLVIAASCTDPDPPPALDIIKDDDSTGVSDSSGLSDSTGITDSTGLGDSTDVGFDVNLPVIISEVYSANADYKDEFGGDPGWVEFYNPADTVANLNGYCLTNNIETDPARWCFGDVAVPPRGYVTVFMSGRDDPDLRNLRPPSDSIDIIKEAAGTWAWADSQAEPIAGRSTASSEFSADPPKFSGRLEAVDNSSAGWGQQALGWTSAAAMLVMKDWDDLAVTDMSRANQVLLRGFVNKDSKLEVRFVSPGVADHQAWPAVLTGTGVDSDLYIIELPTPEENFPDLANINGIRFSNTSSFRGTIEFKFNSITARRRSTNVHVSFTLSAGNGGKLFLTDPNGGVKDSVAYPPGTTGLSYARNLETLAWAHSKPPTPNGANSAETFEGGQLKPPAVTGIPNSGHYENAQSFVIPQGDGGAVIACDVTGKLPSKESPWQSGMTVDIKRSTVMRCAQFKDGAYPSDPVMRTYIIGRRPDLPIVSIAVDPFDMFDNTHGLYSRGPNASGQQPHYGANYWAETELPVQIDFFENGVMHEWNHRAGLRIFGNWSRMFNKKSVVITFREIYGASSLKYRLFPEKPSLTSFKHFILRNNGNNFDQDYIRDMLMTSLTEGMGIDYQKGRPVIVYYNGEYYGIHNLRERANGDYFETNYNMDEDLIDLVKAHGEASRGSDADYQDIIRWLESLNGLSDDDLSELSRRIDIDNFTYNHQARVYYHDRDWPGNNMKRWRSRSPQTKWKWLMYDTDHGWGSHGQWNQPHVPPLDFVTAANGPDWPNPPYATFLLRKLLENESYRRKFINTFSLMMAAYYSNDRVDARINALMAPIQSETEHDMNRWGHDPSNFESQLSAIRNFNRTRTPEMQREIERFFRLSNPVSVTLLTEGGGDIYVNDMKVLGGGATFTAYADAPMTLRASGGSFSGWSDGVTEPERVVAASEAMTLTARFGAGLTRRPARPQ